ncbi:MAG TPA: glutamate-5-semialdehyde dehydrogenase [Flexilinea sp.]|nr:glutamate-5-semialdehyde dehydrogenase [Flexilinea sp.]
MKTILQMGQDARKASKILATAETDRKNAFLLSLADLLESDMADILSANAEDVAEAEGVLSPAMVDRLLLNEQRIKGMAKDLRNVVELPDPVGEIFERYTNPDGLKVRKERIPIGVIAVIYESRPNVTVDSAGLMIKSGNAAILRGGKETIRTNQALISSIQNALSSNGLPADAIQFIDSPDRSFLLELLQSDSYVDMVIPRGGSGLHEFCRNNSRIPVITGGIGICHLFVDESADLQKSSEVIRNAKVQRPTVCNALETVLIHRSIAEEFIPKLCAKLAADGVSFKVDGNAYNILLLNGDKSIHFEKAGENDFDTEWLSLILSVKVVDDVKQAIDHISLHGTGHSDGILSENQENIRRFTTEVNSACVYVNASTRFTDGAELGLGAEIAISTQPLHARGPMALRELTTYKWVIEGDYQTRK